MKTYVMEYAGNETYQYVEIGELPQTAIATGEEFVVYDVSQKSVEIALNGQVAPTGQTSRHRLVVEGKATSHLANNKKYIVVEWGNVTNIVLGFFGLGYKFVHDEPTEPTVIMSEPTESLYAPYTDDDMALLEERPMSETVAHKIAHDDKLVVYKFVGDIEDAMNKSVHYGYQWEHHGNLVSTAFLYARTMTDKYINDNRYGKTGDYRVRESWYRVGKPDLNVTCWLPVQLDANKAKKVDDYAPYTGDWDYDTRGRAEYSKNDGRVRGNYDTDYQD